MMGIRKILDRHISSRRLICDGDFCDVFCRGCEQFADDGHCRAQTEVGLAGCVREHILDDIECAICEAVEDVVDIMSKAGCIQYGS